MPDIYPEERAWTRAVLERGYGNIPTALRVVGRPEKFWERRGIYGEKFEDFKFGRAAIATNDQLGDWTATFSGVGASAVITSADVDATFRCNGVMELNTGTLATGLASLHQKLDSTLLGQGTGFRICARLRVLTARTAGEEFTVQFGWHDLINGATNDAVDGVYFEYSALGEFWEAVARSNSAQSSNLTASAVDHNNYQVLEIEVNPAGNHAWFRVNGAQSQLLTTNIPTGAGRQTGIGFRILKTVGISARQVRIDWFVEHYSAAAQR